MIVDPPASLKWPQARPRWPKISPRAPQECPKTPQPGPCFRPRGPKKASKSVKMTILIQKCDVTKNIEKPKEKQ